MASVAQAMARNYSLAEYVTNNSDQYSVSTAALEELKSPEAATFDFFRWLNTGDTRLGTYFKEDDLTALKAAATAYIATDTNGKSQAQADAAAFYALMTTIHNSSTGENAAHDPAADSDEYMASMRSYANMVGAVLTKTMGEDDINSVITSVDGAKTIVIITATKSNGTLRFKVSPESADPRDEAAKCAKTHSTNLNLTYQRGFLLNGTRVTGNVGTIEICSIDDAYANGTVTVKNAANVDVNVTFTVEDSSIVTCEGGKLTAIKSGSTTLTVTYNDYSVKVTIIVH